jgi:hypothetical protein
MPISPNLFYHRKNLTPEYFGIDSEASATGTERTREDIHTIQICSSRGEHTGTVFWNPNDFKEWLRDKRPRPKILYAFTLPFEYGTLAAWELLHASTEQGLYPWQSWADEPINLFYIQIDKTRIPIYDIRIFFHQLRHGNNALTNLKAVGDYLSDYYNQDIHKLNAPLGEDFGKRAPTTEEKPYFEKYGIRDAFICAKGAQWIHENIINNWLQDAVLITRIYSWGTVAKHFFHLPKIATITRYGKRINIIFPNQWHKRIFESTYAGRSEAFYTGNVGQAFYNDVSSLYPTSIIQTQCMLIRDVEQWHSNTDGLYGKLTWQNFYEQTGFPYGWILGDFKTDNDIWGLPVKVGENNWYITGTLKNHLYNTLDLQGSNAEITDVQAVLIPVFTKDPAFVNPMRKYEQLTKTKIANEYKSEIESHCIKTTINATSGILGKSRPNFGATTNIPAYNIMLGQSHLFMSEIFHRYHTQQHPIFYCDTDSLFWYQPIEETIRECQPYPSLPFQTLQTVPLKVTVKGESQPEGTIIFRGKMYYQNVDSLAFSAWKPFPRFFIETIKQKPTETTIERQISRKWRTRDGNAVTLKIGRWFIAREQWDLDKLKQIFRADDKRCRESYDSYQLFLDNNRLDSRAWTAREALLKLEKIPFRTVQT